MSISEKLAAVAENVDRVYMAGENYGNKIGYDFGYAAGYEDGKTEGGGGNAELPSLDAPAEPSDIRLGKEVLNADGEKVTGTMPEYDSVDTQLNLDNSSYHLPEGYYKDCLVNVDSTGLRAAAKADEQVIVRAENRKFLVEVIIEPASDIYSDGIKTGEEHGRGLERHEFWDAFQFNGTRADWNYAFYGEGWTDDNFFPIYDILFNNCQMVFERSKITDMKQRLADCGVKLIFGEDALSLYYFFRNAAITHLPEIGGTSVTNAEGAFLSCSKLQSIDKVVLSDTKSCSCTRMFNGCSALTEVRFNENIRPTNLVLSACKKLSKDSIENIVKAIAKDHTGSITISKDAIDSAYADRSEWSAFLAENKPTEVSIVEG